MTLGFTIGLIHCATVEGAPDQEAVSRHRENPTTSVQTATEADGSHSAKGQAARGGAPDQGGADEEDSHVGHAVREDHRRHGTAADCELTCRKLYFPFGIIYNTCVRTHSTLKRKFPVVSMHVVHWDDVS